MEASHAREGVRKMQHLIEEESDEWFISWGWKCQMDGVSARVSRRRCRDIARP